MKTNIDMENMIEFLEFAYRLWLEDGKKCSFPEAVRSTMAAYDIVMRKYMETMTEVFPKLVRSGMRKE
jgi:hypothetical protein